VAPATEPPRLRWLRSFYWRIAITFVVVTLAVVGTQALLFSFLVARWNAQDPSRAPMSLARAAAAELGSALEENAALDIDAHVRARYGRVAYGLFVVLRDGHVAHNGVARPSDDAVAAARAVLANTDVRMLRRRGRMGRQFVMAPVDVNGALKGLVVVPPARGGVLWLLQRWLSWPGTLVLVVGTILAAVLVFAPVRRRLRALEEATERLGRGDLRARAPEGGGDEIARVAQSFNRMAEELAARDEALRASDRLRRQMLADVSHELRTPLTSIRAYIETLQMPEVAADADRRSRYFSTMEHETRRLERIVSDLVDLARYESGVDTLEPRVFSLARLFTQVAARHEREAEARQVSIDCAVDDAADDVTADPHRIDQAVDNLVANALRHTSGGGRVTLRAWREADRVVLSISDTGEGIAPEHLPHVFERFYKVDPSRPGGTAGSGLGLSIVKAIVERHGGTIRAASEPGRTEFTIELPQGEG
jgi:two-component system sensor histidine kinase BaeS